MPPLSLRFCQWTLIFCSGKILPVGGDTLKLYFLTFLVSFPSCDLSIYPPSPSFITASPPPSPPPPVIDFGFLPINDNTEETLVLVSNKIVSDLCLEGKVSGERSAVLLADLWRELQDHSKLCLVPSVGGNYCWRVFGADVGARRTLIGQLRLRLNPLKRSPLELYVHSAWATVGCGRLLLQLWTPVATETTQAGKPPIKVLLNLLRCGRSTATRQTFLAVRSSPETSTASAQVGGALLGMVGVRQASGVVRFDSDGSGRPVTWDSFGIWDNRIEEPILLPSSIRYGKPIPQVSLSRVGSASVLGLRKQNEDRLRFARIHDNLLYFAVFDGHGGPHAADYCYTFMEKFKAFLDADKALYTHLSYFNNASFLTAGTTATVALLRDSIELVVGSVGDSRAMLCRKGQANKLTTDHTPDRKDERHRIQKFGGYVTWNSVGQANVNGRLAMTRSIGDFHLKSNGVIAEPDTHRLNIHHASDSFLALTTDGINFLLSDQEICDAINQCHDPTEAADVIAQQALQYGSEDNSTIIIVPFGAWGKHQSSTAGYSMSRNFASRHKHFPNYKSSVNAPDEAPPPSYVPDFVSVWSSVCVASCSMWTDYLNVPHLSLQTDGHFDLGGIKVCRLCEDESTNRRSDHINISRGFVKESQIVRDFVTDTI
ncbi:hypothetical protein INR49_022706 [Caranx melampygus]|nr:hypothetical protein INR49_022706 [Caranx melampygus]